MSILFDCKPEQIAENSKEISEDTLVYIGEWNVKVFQEIKKYPNIKHLYKSFPEEKIFMQTLETDPAVDSPERAEAKLKEKNIWLSDYGKDILYKTEFSKTKEKYELVRFTVAELGFTDAATTDQIYKRAEELGLSLCPAEVGPQLRLSYPGREWMLIAMKQVVDRGGYPSVFGLYADDAKLKLYGSDAKPGKRWGSGRKFVFLSRKS